MSDKDDTVGQGIDRINARYFDEAGNRVSGLRLEEIGLDAHGVANTLWRISAYLKKRAGDNGAGKLLRASADDSSRF